MRYENRRPFSGEDRIYKNIMRQNFGEWAAVGGLFNVPGRDITPERRKQITGPTANTPFGTNHD